MSTCCGVVALDCLLNQNKPDTIFYCCGVVTGVIEESSVRRIRHGMVLDFLKCVELGEEVDDNVTKIWQPFNLCIILLTDPVVFGMSDEKALPFVNKIPEGLYVGRVIQIDGKVHSNANRFHVNLTTAGSVGESDVFFHFNPRFDRRVVVRNTKRKGSWGEEEIAAGQSFPLEPGKGFRLTFYVADGQIMVAINQTPFCSYSWKMALQLVRYLEIDGDVSLKSIQYAYSLRYPFIYKHKNLQLIAPKSHHGEPIIVRKIKLISPGTVIDLYGKVKLLPQNFYINLQEGATLVPHPLIPLHINLRLCQPGHQEQRIVLNSWINGSWGSEIHPDCCPFLPGLEFILTVIYLDDGFHISVNRQFVASFPLRMPCAPWLDTVLVHGDVIITKLKINRFSMNTVKN